MEEVEILVLDFGSQYTQLIARRLRESGVYTQILPYFESFDSIKSRGAKGLILSGGPASVYESDAPKPDSRIFSLGLPVLGICYGMQYIADFFGGVVQRSEKQEFGRATLQVDFKNLDGKTDIFRSIFKDIFNRARDIDSKDSKNQKNIESLDSIHTNYTHSKLRTSPNFNPTIWMSHADKVTKLPTGFVSLASSENTKHCVIADFTRKIYALQFHPEVVHTQCGSQILKNFAIDICGASNKWNMRSFKDEEITKLHKKIGNDKVLCAVSGGVDSSVVATLLHRAIGESLVPVFVDTGLLRLGEREAVERMFKENLGAPLITIDASATFLHRLKGIIEPESKRKIIGKTFIEIFEGEAKKHNKNGEIKYLAQGTLYPDVIESVNIKGPSKVIKSHHNVGGLPEWMRFELVEPLRELFKDEVRILGRELGMPEFMIERHPFPGPGLAIRILGEIEPLSLEILRRADSIFVEALRDAGLYKEVWQAFCVLLNVKSVGVMGDNRTYDNTIALRAVNALDGMSASFTHLPYDFLESVSNKIINEVAGINRVVYDITSKPPGTIEWE